MKSSRAKIHGRFHKIPQVVFTKESRLTSYAGLVIFQALFTVLDLKKRLRACASHLRHGSIFGHGTMILLLVVHLLLGFRRLRDLDYYRDDPLIARILGLRKLPDVATVSRALKAVDAQAVDRTRNLLRDLVLEGLRRAGFARLTLDFDGSVQSTKGHAEGTAVGFNKQKKGARSYYPLFCTVAQSGQFFDLHHRPGNVHDSNGAPGFMSNCVEEFRSALPGALLEARIDAAFFSDEVLTNLGSPDVEFTCSVPFERFPPLKGLIEKRQRWRRIDSRWSYFECDWRPKCWDTSFRFLCLRQKTSRQRRGPIQLDLFEPKSFEYVYKVIVTNKKGSAKNVLLFHNGRGAQEKVFGESKQHAAVDLIPTRTKTGNLMFTLAGMLAHNLGRELQMATRPAERPTLPKRPSRWEFLDLGTLRQRYLHRAGTVSQPQGELTLTLSANPTVSSELLHFLDQLQKAA